MHYTSEQFEEFKRGKGPLRSLHNRIRVHEGHPSHRFAEAFVAHKLETENGWRCWAGTYKVFTPASPRTRRFIHTDEIRQLFLKGKKDPYPLYRRVKNLVLRGTDVLAYDPRRKTWCFYEVKREHDRLRGDQIKSLAVIRDYGLGNVAVIRLVPVGKTVKQRSYEYDSFAL